MSNVLFCAPGSYVLQFCAINRKCYRVQLALRLAASRPIGSLLCGVPT